MTEVLHKSGVVFTDVDSVKRNPLAVAVLICLAYHKTKRSVPQLLDDLRLSNDSLPELIDVVVALDRSCFIRPNPHRNKEMLDIDFVLAEKGFFLVNELKVQNPILLKEINPELKAVA